MKVLVIAAHPDDEILGCGATMARHAALSDTVDIIIVAEGATSRPAEGEKERARLRSAACQAAGVVGARTPHLIGLPDNRLDSIALLDVIQPIEDIVDRLAPDVVYTHHGSDLNVDHRIVHQAVMTACRPVPNSSVRKIFGFETLSSTEWATAALGLAFSPTCYVEISRFLAVKQAALKCYSMEMRPFPHPRSHETIEARAKVWGSFAGLAAAEAFEIYRQIET